MALLNWEIEQYLQAAQNTDRLYHATIINWRSHGERIQGDKSQRCKKLRRRDDSCLRKDRRYTVLSHCGAPVVWLGGLTLLLQGVEMHNPNMAPVGLIAK